MKVKKDFSFDESNLNKLQNGHYYSYREICSLLGTDVEYQTARKIQEQFFRRYMILEPNDEIGRGRKYRVTITKRLPES